MKAQADGNDAVPNNAAPGGLAGATMRVALATDPGRADWPNEDFAAVAAGAAVVLDGATTRPGADTGCVHGVAWYARTLGCALLGAMVAEPAVPLEELLAEAIAAVSGMHGGTCDLSNPATPGTTVLAARAAADGVDTLVLSDSVLVAGYAGQPAPLVITDDHRAARADPAVASRARTERLPADGLEHVVLLTDGATRVTDVYGILSWRELLDVIAVAGPGLLIQRVREAEWADADCSRWPRGKRHDDATIVAWDLAPRPS